MSVRLLTGDCRDMLKTLPNVSVQCCVTSPPYYGLRDYGVNGQIGLEASPDEYVATLVHTFREVRRVLTPDGTLWLNLGDSYVSNGRYESDRSTYVGDLSKYDHRDPRVGARSIGIKPKDLLMMPARVAIALQSDGWYLRSDIIWAKPNPMPESVTDRPTSSHEHVFLLTKQPTYYYDAGAIAEPAINVGRVVSYDGTQKNCTASDDANDMRTRIKRPIEIGSRRNARNVWTIATKPYGEAHFATFPPELVERCVKAGSKPGDMVLDPFFGAGTTGLVCDRLGRDCIGIDLNSKYADMARERITNDAPLFAEVM